MQDSITIAEVGSIVKVSGSRIATPLGPPSPGSTPTKTPSTRPTIISASVFHVSRTVKPCNNRPKASISSAPYEWRAVGDEGAANSVRKARRLAPLPLVGRGRGLGSDNSYPPPQPSPTRQGYRIWKVGAAASLSRE